MAVATTVENKVHLFLQLASKKVRVDQAFIFGSSAKGGRREWSDIDLAIVSQDFSGDPFEDSRIFFPIILQVDRSIEVHPFHPDDFSSENPFVREILDTGVKIIEQN
jgi:predicted nucleotidyltransferase